MSVGIDAQSLGLAADYSANGLGVRGLRFAMVIEDNVVRVLNVENPGQFEVSSAEAIISAL